MCTASRFLRTSLITATGASPALRPRRARRRWRRSAASPCIGAVGERRPNKKLAIKHFVGLRILLAQPSHGWREGDHLPRFTKMGIWWRDGVSRWRNCKIYCNPYTFPRGSGARKGMTGGRGVPPTAPSYLPTLPLVPSRAVQADAGYLPTREPYHDTPLPGPRKNVTQYL